MGLNPEADGQPEESPTPTTASPPEEPRPVKRARRANRSPTEAPPPAGAESQSGEVERLASVVAPPTPDAEQPPALRPLPALGRSPGKIVPSDSFASAGRKAMWPHVGRMFGREAALRDPAETDALKRYRVATRRLRAALRVFRDAYPPRETKPLRNALAVLADALGVVRDLDVRIQALERWAAEQGDGAPEQIAPLRDAWMAQRRAAAAVLIRQLETKRHARLLAQLAAFVTAPEPPASRSADAPQRTIADRAASSVWAAYEEVRAYSTVVKWADLETLHDLRIEAKRLRYVLEFLGDVLGPEREPVVEGLVGLQDQLGALNDATIAVDAVRTFLGERHATLDAQEQAIVERYLAEHEREAGRLRRGLDGAWRPVVSVTFARRLGRAVVVRSATQSATQPATGTGRARAARRVRPTGKARDSAI